MPNSIADSAVALSLIREALTLLDAPEHAGAADHLRRAINELSSDRPHDPSPFGGKEDRREP